MVALIRADDINLPLFLHVLGAMLLVGALAFVGALILLGWRSSDRAVALTRLALRMIPYAVLPAYILMRVGAQWTEAAWDYPDGFDPAWIGVGYITADLGALLLLVSLILSWIGLRKLRDGRGLGLGRAVGVISLVLVAAYVVAVWAMTAKPT